MKEIVNIDDFGKLELRVGTIKSAEKVDGSEKLLRLEVDFGEIGLRQILSGIAKHYSPEDLVDSQRVFIVNLEPRKMMGLESQGMILAAGDEDTISTLIPDKDVNPGSEIH